MIELKAPSRAFPQDGKVRATIFLAGSIEMGKAENWQQKVVRLLADEDVVILNPRRDDWDSSWVQKKENKQFNEQVTWELESQEAADIILMYFDPKTQSPITLLELGLFIKEKHIIICCPEGYFRKGNVDIVCERYGATEVKSIEEVVAVVKEIV